MLAWRVHFVVQRSTGSAFPTADTIHPADWMGNAECRLWRHARTEMLQLAGRLL